MWNRVNLLRKLQYLYISNVQQAPKPSVPENIKLTHRFLEYFQANNAEKTLITNSQNIKGVRALLEMDKNLCSKASEMSNSEILQYLTIYLLNSPRKVTNFDFYKISNSILAHRIEELTAQEFVQFMYMVALKKNSYEASRHMKKCMFHLNTNPEMLRAFSLTDLLVLCNATFKTSTRIYNKELLSILQQCLLNNLHLFDDPGMLVTLIKSLRHNECQNEELLATISAVIFFNQTYKHYTFTAISHILPLFADYLYYDEKLFELFTQRAINQLITTNIREKRAYFIDNIRGKDIKRFLWSCSFVGHHLNQTHLKLFEEEIYARSVNGYYDDEPETLLDSVFYLWMLEFHSEKLLNLCKDKIGVIRKMQTKTKIRLNMLLICMQVEDMQLYKRFGVKAEVFKADIKQELEKRPNLMKIYNVLKVFMSDLDVNRLEFEYQVPHFKVLGITGYRKNVYKAFVVEVLDESNRVKNVDEKMSGRLQVKTRLMYKMDLTVVLLNSADFEDLNDSELKEYVRREMSIVP